MEEGKGKREKEERKKNGKNSTGTEVAQKRAVIGSWD